MRPTRRTPRRFSSGRTSSSSSSTRSSRGRRWCYSWTATAPVIYDFHSEPEGAPPGYAESFDKAEAPAANGTYTAPFSGIHGWFWENPGKTLVTITLNTAGFYTAAQEFKDNDSSFHPVDEIQRR